MAHNYTAKEQEEMLQDALLMPAADGESQRVFSAADELAQDAHKRWPGSYDR